MKAGPGAPRLLQQFGLSACCQHVVRMLSACCPHGLGQRGKRIKHSQWANSRGDGGDDARVISSKDCIVEE